MANEDKKFCSTHSDKPAVTTCNVCGKMICQECRQRFGYFCSIECKNKSLSSINKDELRAKNIEEQKISKILSAFKIVFFLAHRNSIPCCRCLYFFHILQVLR